MTFLIETKQREPIHDFTWELIQAKAYNDWAGHGRFDVRRIDDPKDFADIPFPDERIPIGSIEFVSRFVSHSRLKTGSMPQGQRSRLISPSDKAKAFELR